MPRRQPEKTYLLGMKTAEFEAWSERARAQGLSFAEWVRRACRYQLALPLSGVPLSPGPVQRRPVDRQLVAVPLPRREGRGQFYRPETVEPV